MQMITYCTPTLPGRSRLFYCLVADKEKAPKAMKRAMALRPKWLLFLNHFQRNNVLDGDTVFLHGQVSLPAYTCFLTFPVTSVTFVFRTATTQRVKTQSSS